MRLLFDHNLSPKLVRRLADLYPDSTHVTDAGLDRATDIELDQRLAAFEQQYQLTSAAFYAQYEAGQLGDSADFMEWSSFCDMQRATQQYLDWLRGDG